MYQIIIVIHVLLGLGIIGLIMIQQGKGADAGASFGSGSSGSVFGAQGAGSFLSRTTATLAALFFLTSLGLAVLNGRQGAAYDLMSAETAKKDAIGIPQADINKSVENLLANPPAGQAEQQPTTTPPVEQPKAVEATPSTPVTDGNGAIDVKPLPESPAPVAQEEIKTPDAPKAEEAKPAETAQPLEETKAPATEAVKTVVVPKAEEAKPVEAKKADEKKADKAKAKKEAAKAKEDKKKAAAKKKEDEKK